LIGRFKNLKHPGFDGVERAIPPAAFDLDLDREGHGLSRAEKLPIKSTRL